MLPANTCRMARVLLMMCLLSTPLASATSLHRTRGERRAMTMMRDLQAVTVRKGKGGPSKKEVISSAQGWSEEEQEQEACEKKGKGRKCSIDEDDSEETPVSGGDGTDQTDSTDDGGYWDIIEGAEESLPPSDISLTASPTLEGSDSNPVDLPVATSVPTPSIVETEIPTFKPSAALPAVSTEAPVASTLAPTFALTSATDDQASGGDSSGSSGDGMFDGEDFFNNRLVPFAVSIEGDDVTNDLGITSCLLTEMQRNMSSLFNIEMENFTIVEFEDADGDGFKRFNMYFSGFGEYVGEFYTEEYAQEVQLNVIGDGVEFFQSCLDARWGNSDRSFTASQLDYYQSQTSGQNQGNDVDGIQGSEVSGTGASEVGDDDSQLETNLIIGLVVAGVVVALAGIVFAARVLRGNREAEDENSKLIEGQEGEEN